ncbi:sensory box histidine kinase [marine gamma proteobacterium HTCC2080]|nr:sensory box histidine kinase [marine gamma proteobacterium HTCC2080]
MSADDDRPAAEELAARLKHSARLASVGKLASSAAHEINQPLNVIRMAAFNLRRVIEKGTLDAESALKKLERIDTQIARAARLVGGMKAFSPTGADTTTNINPTEALVTALELMAKRFTGADIELIYSADETTDNSTEDSSKGTSEEANKTIEASPSAFQELIVNLLDNAIEAYGEAPQRNPLLEDEGLPPRWIKVVETAQARELTITIEDAAGGVTPKIAHQAFQPFITTAEDGSHAGLGLTVCASIAASMGGAVTLARTELGSKATVSLPLTESF